MNHARILVSALGGGIVSLWLASCAVESTPPPTSKKDAAAADAESSTPAGLPASASEEDIMAFVKAGLYKKAPWIAETAAARAMMPMSASPHGTVRVWMNEPLVTSLKAGRDGRKPTGQEAHPPHDQWSMAVKELYDDAGTALEGAAVMFKDMPGTASNTWTYFCYGPEGRCSTGKPSPESEPIIGRGITVPCGYCHGGTIYTKAP